MARRHVDPTHEIVIEPSHGWVALHLGDLWRYRGLLYFLTWRDVLVRYKQALFGVAWAVFQPVLTMVVFGVIFGRLAGLPSDGQPYPVFVFVALLPWQLFAGALQRSSMSLVNNSNLLTKVYFPRLVIPVSAVLAGLIDFCISLGVLAVLMAAYRISPTVNVVWLPLFVLYALITALAVGLWLSALNVLYRDVGYILPFLVQVWMYASPVAYSASLVPTGKWSVVYALNPMVGVIQAFRWALLAGPAPGVSMLVSVAVVAVLLVSGLVYFRRTERRFADIV